MYIVDSCKFTVVIDSKQNVVLVLINQKGAKELPAERSTELVCYL